jgi:Sulfotransferase domain
VLVWSVSDGWEPLCEFLELPVSETDVPHLNDSKEFADRIIDGAIWGLQRWRVGEAPPVAAT